ncbi:Biphenyl-2,3-diol 1,2-dioxygenase [Paraburkholderia caffeinitolerans]|uniref:Biphenyl-2,3-diol 1,2-dioxygenase n=1 Tax=Paraburkholderia caffeinitolerans TaxID=1723730 RepID=A0A6J5FWI9_9BURK|nr:MULTISPECIES: VOC family protein [Paraburkholderia]CAB3788771.1 Biphenyl-2,3-diol 1,2-dioxygenase [Paraburkholderia caffeinitolerans]
MINALSYIVVQTPHMQAWVDQVTNHIGMQVEVLEAGKTMRIRADQKIQRFVVTATSGEPTMGMGFEVPDASTMQACMKALDAAGYTTTPGTAEEIEFRGVQDMVHFVDNDGLRLEIAYGLKDASTEFKPGRPIGGFRTGKMGLGHVALITEHFEALSNLYRNVLGMNLTDYTYKPFKVEFLHCNPRHHTIGIAHTGQPAKIYHLMLEYNDFDDVGRAYDMALPNPDSIGVTLGRHINDHATSFYLKNPDGWMFELGWATRTVGPDWEAEELKGMSLWGHDRTWLPDHKREEARQILRDLAAEGLRAPVVLPENQTQLKQNTKD